jgi:hypothetical protein
VVPIALMVTCRNQQQINNKEESACLLQSKERGACGPHYNGVSLLVIWLDLFAQRPRRGRDCSPYFVLKSRQQKGLQSLVFCFAPHQRRKDGTAVPFSAQRPRTKKDCLWLRGSPWCLCCCQPLDCFSLLCRERDRENL